MFEGFRVLAEVLDCLAVGYFLRGGQRIEYSYDKSYLFADAAFQLRKRGKFGLKAWFGAL